MGPKWLNVVCSRPMSDLRGFKGCSYRLSRRAKGPVMIFSEVELYEYRHAKKTQKKVLCEEKQGLGNSLLIPLNPVVLLLNRGVIIAAYSAF